MSSTEGTEPVQALARKWRPRSFAEVSGQEHVVRALVNALSENRLHHAYLFTGTRGVGKTTLARVLAKALNCETGVTAQPCGRCSACLEIDTGRFVDLIELDAASNTQVDSMRELLESALYVPTRGRFKIYIIDEVHMLSRSAFNAMLKTLEEPPEHVKFILATTDPQKVPMTVLSRCLQFGLKTIPLSLISEHLGKVLSAEQVAFEPPALNLIARAAQGSMRDGLSLLDQAIAHGGGHVDEASVRAMLGTVGADHLFALLDALVAEQGRTLIAIADEMQAASVSFEAALQDLAALLSRVAMAQVVLDALPADDPDRERVMSLAKRISKEDVQLFYQIALRGRADLDLAPDEYAGFTMTLLRMLAFAPEPVVGEPEPRPTLEESAAPASRSSAATAAASGQEESATPPPLPTGGGSQDWAQLLQKLKLGGMARMLAQHCELMRMDDRLVHLRVPDARRHLLEKPYRDKLQSALEEHLGHRLRVDFEVGEPSGQTPAEMEDRARETSYRRAVESIDRDPFVRELVDEFDARVVDDSIRPVDAQTAGNAGRP